jgi:hypothetical protein
MAAPGHFNQNHLTELQYDFETLWPVLVVGFALTTLLFVVAALPATAPYQRVIRLVSAAPALGAFIVFGLYWLRL